MSRWDCALLPSRPSCGQGRSGRKPMDAEDKIDLIAAILAAAEIGAGKISESGAVARFRMLREQLHREGLAGSTKELVTPPSNEAGDQSPARDMAPILS